MKQAVEKSSVQPESGSREGAQSGASHSIGRVLTLQGFQIKNKNQPVPWAAQSAFVNSMLSLRVKNLFFSFPHQALLKVSGQLHSHVKN